MMDDCIIIGGGIAGLQASIQLGRYRHKVLVVDKGRGRSTLCQGYRNMLGWPDGVSGPELRRLGRLHAERLGIEFREAEATAVARIADGHFQVMLDAGQGAVSGATLLIATGVSDRYPDLPGLEGCLGRTIFVCSDCDGYESAGRRTVVLGSGVAGYGMATALTYWCDRIVYVNHERQALGSERLSRLKELGIEYIEEEIAEVLTGPEEAERIGPAAAASPFAGQASAGAVASAAASPSAWQAPAGAAASAAAVGGRLSGVRLTSGRVIPADIGFIAFGGNAVHSGLLAHLGVERMENGHIVVDPRSKMTSVRGIWAAGDIAVHSQQATIAMGEGAQAAIWIHKELLKLRPGRSAASGEALLR